MDKKKLGFVVGVLGTTAALTASYFFNFKPSYADFIDKDAIARFKSEQQVVDVDAKDSSDEPAGIEKKDKKEAGSKSQKTSVYNHENQVEYIVGERLDIRKQANDYEEKPKAQVAPFDEGKDKKLEVLEQKAVEDLPDLTEDEAQQEADLQALEKAEAKAAEQKAKEEAERKAKEEAERKAQEEADRKAKEEAERKAKEEAEKKAKEEAERKAKEEAERKAKEEAERKAKEEAERKAREEAERKAQEEAERKAREEAERKAQEEAERKAKEEAEKKAQEEAEKEAEQNNPVVTNLSEARKQVVAEAYKHLGTPYVWAGNGPNNFDCSGFTCYVYQHAAGITLPRTAYDQQFVGTKVGWNNMEPGDLIYFKTLGGRYDHVGIYIGNRQMIHASSSQGQITIADFNDYWAGAFVSAHRVLN